jgi:hypothetical protein
MKSFRYLQVLYPGDLAIAFSSRNTYSSPYAVTYSMYQIMPNGARVSISAPRTASKDSTGIYHVVGRAGEAGQPGQWLVRWEYQESFGSTVEAQEETFSVVDAVAAHDPSDVTVRVTKYGWT